MGLDYYAILGVLADASDIDIKLAYRKLALQSHPKRKIYAKNEREQGLMDRQPFPELPLSLMWEYINEAYDVLTNDLYRAAYDLFGEEGIKAGVATPNGCIQPYIYHKDYFRTYRNAIGQYSPYSDLIDAVAKPPPLYKVNNKFGVKIKDPDIEQLLYLDLNEIFHGAVKKKQISRQEFVDADEIVTSKKDKILIIPIAPGTLPGTKIRFIEEGDRGPTIIPADIVFTTTDIKHEVFERDGCNLWMTCNVDLREAICGVTVHLHTIDFRRINILITDVISPSYVKEVEKEGLPIVNDTTKKGSLFIRFNVEFPVYLPRPCLKHVRDAFQCVDTVEI